MRTDEPRPRSTSANSNPLQTGVIQIRRWLADLGPRTRLILAASALVVLLAAGYYAANPTVTESETAWLFDTQSLSQEHARSVLAALATAKIPASPGRHGQIAVPATRKSDALALLSKQKLLPKGLREIQDEAANTSIWSLPLDRASQREQVSQREAGEIIGNLEGIESASVLIRRSTTRTPGQKGAKICAFVWVQTQDGRPILHQTLQAIPSILRNIELDLPPNSVTVMDHAGKIYLDSGNPEAGAAMMGHVLEEELRSKILQDLNWIEGVRVLVALATPTPPEPATTLPKEPAGPVVVMNLPAEIVETSPAPRSVPTPIVSPVPGKARILVQVPISYYLHSYQTYNHREATLDELKPYGVKVDDSIRSTIQNGIPASQIASLKIDRIDSPGPIPPPIATVEATTIRLPQWLVPAAAGASVALVILVMMGTRWMVARRPTTVGVAVPRAHFEVTDDAVPTGRVRELVRRDPAAAAGVLGRWIGQGGPTS